MSLQNKFFNFGLFKNNFKRFKWGSFLYFVILLISGPIAMALEHPYEEYFRYHHIPQMICAIFAVPVIAAVLIFRYLHTRKQTDMFHSLPISRGCMYITNLVSIAVLVMLPVILNGIVTYALGVAYDYSLRYIVYSTLWQLYISFIMLSVSVLAVMLTGNSFAAIIITYIINLLPAAYIALTAGIFEEKLYGFYQIGGVAEYILMYLPMIRFCNLLGSFSAKNPTQELIGWVEIIIYILIASVLLFVSYVLYKKRKSETANEVVAFKILNPIFKLTITFIVSMLGYFVFSATEGNRIFMIITVVLITFVVWFGLEMVITKSIRVFKKFKGFLVFCVIVIAVCAEIEGGGMGFETRVPDISDVVSIQCEYSYPGDEGGTITSSEVIAEIINLHKSLINDMAWYEDSKNERYDGDRICIIYNLKNGKQMKRNYYWVETEREREYLEKLYSYPEFKQCAYSVYRMDLSKVSQVNLNTNYMDISFVMEKTDGLYEAIIKDINELGFDDIRSESGNFLFRIQFYEYNEEHDFMGHLESVEIRSGYKNTIKWLKENGYYEKINSKLPDILRIEKSITEEEQKWRDVQIGANYGETASYGENVIVELNKNEIDVVASITDKNDIAEIIRLRNDGYLTVGDRIKDAGKYYTIASGYGTVGYFYPESAPEVLKKYLP